MCIGALVYWAVGFGLTFGESRPGLARIMGTSYFFFIDMPSEWWCTRALWSHYILLL